MTSNVKYLFTCLNLFVAHITKTKDECFFISHYKIRPQQLVAIKLTYKSLCYCYTGSISMFGHLMHATYSLYVTLNGTNISSYSALCTQKEDKMLLIIRIGAPCWGRELVGGSCKCYSRQRNYGARREGNPVQHDLAGVESDPSSLFLTYLSTEQL